MASGLAPSGPWPSLRWPSGEILVVVHRTARPAVAAADDPRAGNRDEGDGLRFSRLEPDRGARRNIEAHPVGRASIEHERAVRFDEVIVATDLNRAIAAVGYL